MRVSILTLSLVVLVVFIQCQSSNGYSGIDTSIQLSKTQTNMDTLKNPYYSHTNTNHLDVSLEEWRQILPPDVYHVAFEKGTERAFTGKYWDFTGVGTYACGVCGNILFRSDAKFASSCGWPSFFKSSRDNAVIYKEDLSFGMHRTEVLCARCNAHLGHIFSDGPPPTGKRFCMNSIVLDFLPDTTK